MSQTSAKYPICSSTIPNYQFYCQVECQIQAIYLHYNLTKWSSKRPLYNCRSKGSCWIDTASCVADLWNISGEIPLVSLAVHQQITYKLDLQPVHPTSIHCIRPQQDRESIYQINEGGGGDILIYSLQQGVPALQTILSKEVQIHQRHVFCQWLQARIGATGKWAGILQQNLDLHLFLGAVIDGNALKFAPCLRLSQLT